MKKTKKIVALALAAVLLVCTSVAATVAYLQSTDSVTNTFTVGNVLIVLDEEDTDDSATDVTTEGRDKANEYHLLPGHTYDKDPTVWVDADSEDCYVFVKVTNGLAAILDENGLDIDATKWTDLGNGVYLYKEVLEGGESAVVFTEFTIAGTVSNTVLARYVTENNADAKIVVNAYAIQADGFDATDAEDLATMMTALGL